MQRTKRLAFCASVLMVGANIALSQGIIIGRDDVKLIFAIGQVVTYHHDTLTTTADIGAPGGPVIWDFSGLSTQYLETRTGIAVQSTLYAAGFPQATHAQLDAAFAMRLNTGSLGWATLTSPEAYYYYSIDDDLKYYGVQGIGTGYLDSSPGVPIPYSARWFGVPASVEYRLPVEFGKTWTFDYVDSLVGTATLPPPFNIPYTLAMGDIYSVTCEVDAFGSLTLPGGVTREALRIKRVSTKNSSLLEASYIIVTRNGAAVQLKGNDPSATSGTVAVSAVRWTEGVPDDLVPVQLASFTATQREGSAVDLEWTTLSETNNFGFYILTKDSEEGKFTELTGAFIPGHGTTVVPQKYSYRDNTGGAGARWYRLKQIDLDGTAHLSEPVQVNAVTAVPETAPATYVLSQNYPNPFNPSTNIRYSLPYRSHVTLAVFNALGQQVAQLVDGEMQGGQHEVKFNASGLAGGVFYYRMQARPLDATIGRVSGSGAGAFVETKQLMLLR
jgi:hypothetical protein